MCEPHVTYVEGGPGVDGEGQHGVQVLLVMTSGREHLQPPQGATQAHTDTLLQPIRGQYSGHVISINLSESSIQVT